MVSESGRDLGARSEVLILGVSLVLELMVDQRAVLRRLFLDRLKLVLMVSFSILT